MRRDPRLNLKAVTRRYPIISWRSFYSIAACWSVIALAIYLSVGLSWWFYPVSLILIGNRYIALALLSHEGLHGNLHRNRRVNDWLGRYLCAFPVFLSFSKYRRLHLLHHGTIGSEKWDPDRHLYDLYPVEPLAYFGARFSELLRLRMFRDFALYYTEFPEFWSSKKTLNGKSFVFNAQSDFSAFVIFHVALYLSSIYFGFFWALFLFHTLPIVLIQHPYVTMMGGLQHGPVRADGPEGLSRSIRGSKTYMWILLPLDICFHGEHHLDPSVPHYRLAEFSRELEAQGTKLWRGSYRDALREMFKR